MLRCMRAMLLIVVPAVSVMWLMPMVVSVARAEHLDLLCSLDVLFIDIHGRLVNAEEAALRLSPIAGQVHRLAIDAQIVCTALVAELVRQIQIAELINVARVLGRLRIGDSRIE